MAFNIPEITPAQTAALIRNVGYKGPLDQVASRLSPEQITKLRITTKALVNMQAGKRPVKLAKGGYLFAADELGDPKVKNRMKDNPEFSEFAVDQQDAAAIKTQQRFAQPEDRMNRPRGYGNGGYAEGGMITGAPRTTNIGGQPHALSYINPQEMQLLKDLGGTGQPGPDGIPAFYSQRLATRPRPGETPEQFKARDTREQAEWQRGYDKFNNFSLNFPSVPGSTGTGRVISDSPYEDNSSLLNRVRGFGPTYPGGYQGPMGDMVGKGQPKTSLPLQPITPNILGGKVATSDNNPPPLLSVPRGATLTYEDALKESRATDQRKRMPFEIANNRAALALGPGGVYNIPAGQNPLFTEELAPNMYNNALPLPPSKRPANVPDWMVANPNFNPMNAYATVMRRYTNPVTGETYDGTGAGQYMVDPKIGKDATTYDVATNEIPRKVIDPQALERQRQPIQKNPNLLDGYYDSPEFQKARNFGGAMTADMGGMNPYTGVIGGSSSLASMNVRAYEDYLNRTGNTSYLRGGADYVEPESITKYNKEGAEGLRRFEAQQPKVTKNLPEELDEYQSNIYNSVGFGGTRPNTLPDYEQKVFSETGLRPPSMSMPVDDFMDYNTYLTQQGFSPKPAVENTTEFGPSPSVFGATTWDEVGADPNFKPYLEAKTKYNEAKIKSQQEKYQKEYATYLQSIPDRPTADIQKDFETFKNSNPYDKKRLNATFEDFIKETNANKLPYRPFRPMRGGGNMTDRGADMATPQYQAQAGQTADPAATPEVPLTPVQKLAADQATTMANVYGDPSKVVTPGTVVSTPTGPDTTIAAGTGSVSSTAPSVAIPGATGVSTATAPAVEGPKGVMSTSNVTPAVKAATDAMTAASGSVGANSKVIASTDETSAVSNLKTTQGTATLVTNPVQRKIEAGELVTGVADATTAAAFTEQVQAATALPSVKATVQGQLATLMDDFADGKSPVWAAGAMRAANAAMAARGLGASSMAGQAIIQAAMESALPIAQADAQVTAQFEIQNLSNRQQRAMLAAEQRATFMGMEFTQEFQARVQNSARIGDIANMNFTADQQIALENGRAANTMNLANLSNTQAMLMAEAAALSNLEMTNLSNRQQAAVQNAQNFMQMDMQNLSNEQQTSLFKQQSVVQSLFTDQAATNAASQFNATSDNQTQQFFASLANQTQQFNATQTNAMSQFDADNLSTLQRFNSELENQRDQFNAKNALVIAQANTQWRQNTATIDTAAQNQANMEYAKSINALTSTSIDQIWQRERDLMSFAFTAIESASDRAVQVAVAKLDATSKAELADNMGKGKLFSTLLTGFLGNKGIISLPGAN